MNLLTIPVILCVLVMVMFGQGLNTHSPDLNVTNYTETRLNWTDNKLNVEANQTKVNLLINEGINFVGLLTYTISEEALKYGFNHPNINYTLLTKLLIAYLIVICVTSLVMPIIFNLPVIIALTYLLYKWIKERRNKKWQKKEEK